MTVVKAEYLVAQDSESGEEQNVKFIPPEPSGADLGGITEDERKKLIAITFDNAGSHNAIYRGKDLGTSVTQEQYKNIENGTFKDLYIGDYWTINGTKYIIAHFDYMYNVGATALTKHHVVVVPDKVLYSYVMNDTNITDNGYSSSKMYKSGLDNALMLFKNAFGVQHVLTHENLLVNNTSEGIPKNWIWISRQIDLMSETMVYGHQVWGASGYDVGCQKQQLSLFAHRHDMIVIRENTYWLRDIASYGKFSLMYNRGVADNDSASLSNGVRPYALIG